MLFKAGILYIVFIGQIYVSYMDYTFKKDEDTTLKPPSFVSLSFNEIEKSIGKTDYRAIEQMTEIVMKEQKNFSDRPIMSKYTLTSSNITVYFDNTYFINKQKEFENL